MPLEIKLATGRGRGARGGGRREDGSEREGGEVGGISHLGEREREEDTRSEGGREKDRWRRGEEGRGGMKARGLDEGKAGGKEESLGCQEGKMVPREHDARNQTFRIRIRILFP